MAGNGYKKSRRKSQINDNCPFLPFSADDCQTIAPAAGYRNGTSVNNQGSNGNYWSGTLNEGNSNNAYYLNFNNGNVNWNNNNRNYGHSVRPVSELMQPSASLSPEQLLLDLFRAYKDARRGKRKKTYQLRFEMNLEQELVSLRDELISKKYQPRPSACFVIRDPKTREIFAADFRDRIVHHLYYNYTHVLFERTFISDCYSCIRGRGTHYGIRRMTHHIRSVSENFTKSCSVMKLDVKGYFMHINRKILLRICLDTLRKMRYRPSDVKGKTWNMRLDFSFLEYLSETIILSDPVKQCHKLGKSDDWKKLPPSRSLFKSPEDCGLPIGNLTSQLFSNVYMNVFDQYMKRSLKCVAYGRYVDDAYVVFPDNQYPNEILQKSRRILKEDLELDLNPNKLWKGNVLYGVGFLGSYIKPYRIYISNTTLCRMKKKLRNLDRNLPKDINRMRASLNSYLGVLTHYDCFRIKKEVFGSLHNLFEFGYYGRNFQKFLPYRKFIKGKSCILHPSVIFHFHSSIVPVSEENTAPMR